MITGWGTNTRLKEIHYFRETDGLPLCSTNSKRRSPATLPLPNWNPDHPHTCQRCLAELKKIEPMYAGIGKTSGCEQ
jgi:hypothetical protein